MRKYPEGKTEETGRNLKKPGIVVVGNMNVGKTTLFARMCGRKTTSINIPGNMIAINTGRIKGTDKDALDTPGICSIFSNNEDEKTSRDLLLPHKSDHDIQGIILVADAKNMKRSLIIAIRYAEYGVPMLLNINMVDEISPRGIKIDYDKLSAVLGIDVCTTIAREGIGVQKLISSLADMRTTNDLIEYPDWIEQFFEIIAKLLKPDDISPKAIGTLLLAGDSSIEEYVERKFGAGMLKQLKDLADEYRQGDQLSSIILLTNLYSKKANQIVNDVQKEEPPAKNPFIVKFGDWCTQLSTGIPIAMAVLYIMYLFIGSFGATFLVDTINGSIFEGFLIPWTTKLVDFIPSAFIRDMIIDPDFGILPTGVFLALGLVLPVLFCFYIAFGILEDSGYLSRISILLDKLLQKMGLNGKSVIPFLLLLGMPCAPLSAVMFIILGRMPISASITVFGVIFLQILIAGFIANKILPGGRTPLFMEIPPMRLPKPLQILKMSASKTYFFMKEAVPIFILASFIVFLFERMGGLAALERAAEPVIQGFMGLPVESVQVFIKTIIRRESGATEIEHLSGIYDNVQLVVNLLVMTFLSPCMNATIVLFKERGNKAAITIMGTVMIYAILIGSVVNYTCRLLGITFT